jgi:hypothetical protein
VGSGFSSLMETIFLKEGPHNTFWGAIIKLQRAHHHIRDLHKAFAAFLKSNANSYTIYTHTDPNTREMSINVSLIKRIPDYVPLILSDAIHNLRTALDHATWELIGIDGGQQDKGLQFPAGASRGDYEGACKGIKTSRQDTKDFFAGLAAYKGGAGNDIEGLRRLDNAEKHRIITPLGGVARLGDVKVVDLDTGGVVSEMKDVAVRMGPRGVVTFMKISPGLSVEIDKNTKATLDIFFDDSVEIFAREPIIPTLTHLLDVGSDTIAKFRAFVENRK